MSPKVTIKFFLFAQNIQKQKSRTYLRFILRQLGRLFPKKTRRFPSPSHGGFGFIERISFVLGIQHHLIKEADFVNMKNQFVKIISSGITYSK